MNINFSSQHRYFAFSLSVVDLFPNSIGDRAGETDKITDGEIMLVFSIL